MPTWSETVAFARGLPEVEESTSYNTPALKVKGKLMARLRTEAEGGLVVMCSVEEKAALLAAGDAAFFTTSHYDGHGSVLVDLAVVDTAQLHELLTEAWRLKAPVRLRKEYDEGDR